MLGKPYFLQSPFFTLKVTPGTKSTRLVMRLLIDEVATSNFPQTFDILAQEFPDVLKTACFNQAKLPFHQEVKDTEIGHLFEHLLIAELRRLKVGLGHKKVIYDGLTSWNWIRQPRGTFNIKVTSGREDAEIFPQALENSVFLTQTILASNAKEPSTVRQLAPATLSGDPAYAQANYLRRRARPPLRPALA